MTTAGAVVPRLDPAKEAALLRLLRYDRRGLAAIRFLFDRGLHYQRSSSKVLTTLFLLGSAK